MLCELPSVSVVALLVLLLSTSADAQQGKITTTCACFAFEDANGQSILLPLLTNAPLINGTRISSTYGMRMDPILGFFAMHSGVDFAAPADSPIFAPADGVIEEARDKAELGLYVRVRHNQILATGYAHTSHFAAGICPGVHVARGQVIAYVGSTGLSTGPHLHYAVFINGQLIKPVCSCMTQSQSNFGNSEVNPKPR